jgi:hypothetical protein
MGPARLDKKFRGTGRIRWGLVLEFDEIGVKGRDRLQPMFRLKYYVGILRILFKFGMGAVLSWVGLDLNYMDYILNTPTIR